MRILSSLLTVALLTNLWGVPVCGATALSAFALKAAVVAKYGAEGAETIGAALVRGEAAEQEVATAEIATALKATREAYQAEMLAKYPTWLKVGEYLYAEKPAFHLFDTIKYGAKTGFLERPYSGSVQFIQEIVATGKSIPDLTAPNLLKFVVEGFFNGSKGNYELVIDVPNKIIYHFLFN